MGKWELTMNPVQEWGEEVEEGAVFGITLRREPIQPPADSAEAQTEFSFVQYRTCKLRRLKAATLPRLVAHLLEPSCQETDYARIFLSMHRAFASTKELVELLFQRNEEESDVGNSSSHESSLGPLIHTWLEEHSEDFREPPQYPSLRLLFRRLHRHLAFRRLAQHVDALLKKFQHEETDSCGQASPAQQLEEEVQEDESEDEGLGSENTEEAGDFMDFPVPDVAEELTRLDAELFVKVVPFQCLGCLWSHRDKDESLSPTVRATIAQFNAITNRRARVIEKWIRVAQECRQLRNLSSLRAILSALQSNAIYRLRKTWVAVCRDSMATFEQLCETFPDENCVLRSREILVEDGSQPAADNSSPKTAKRSPISRQLSSPTGVVPYLGTYLTVLTMLDTALPDTVEGLINFEKRRREFEILSQICQLQASCTQYSLPHHPQIGPWLLGSKLLGDQESYELSRELEPPNDTCPSSPGPWSHRLLSKKLSSLLTVSEGSGRKTQSDQISVSSSGSSGSEMEDLNTPQSSSLSLQCLSSSCHNVAFPPGRPNAPPPPGPPPTRSKTSLPPPQRPPAAPSSRPQHKRSVSMTSLPVYNRQVADSCIVRVTVECGNNGNMYKSILLTSQDKTAQVIQRALEKHNLENVSGQEFTLSQVLPHNKELLILDKANVFYAMSTTANYDFVLRRREQGRRGQGSTSSLGSLTGGRHSK
ncbi:hypothetical protein AAFF_G00339330 [Aldrovandia affinis]|uniref:Ral guanine nucleotide dissociation stimulator-like 1 n=1 Tax=Aldrovandia affinis TaxID=143900 RepID=A0AAD7WPF0_9TELE|nr:hypothetical protein AAFF_G00339330 [Aldrovandia affinis]